MMLKEAIEKIQSLSQPVLREIGGETFSITVDGDITQIRPVLDRPDTLTLQSLDALVLLVKTEGQKKLGGDESPLYITIPNHMTARCFSSPNRESRYKRPVYYEAAATDVPGFEESTQLSFEEAMIALRTRFQRTDDTDYALKLLSDITAGAKVTYTDNGVATAVITKTGIALQSNEPIRPVISLCPYRTFQEVAQPSSDFLIRINERGIKFISADGGMWKLKARETIKAFLTEKLAAEIAEKTVFIAL